MEPPLDVIALSPNCSQLSVNHLSASDLRFRDRRRKSFQPVSTDGDSFSLCVASWCGSDIDLHTFCANRCAARLAPAQFQEHAKRSPRKLNNPKSWGVMAVCGDEQLLAGMGRSMIVSLRPHSQIDTVSDVMRRSLKDMEHPAD
ncbi:hypothetical protein H7Q97_03515 [Ochrobactrum sp. CM-21-5]|nr:hypothetical protein [Ochrobactrum sp. CM-21-5]MBC2884468.1 hypothetical protein [Ochrobactrum sp. CM-21-5]